MGLGEEPVRWPCGGTFVPPQQSQVHVMPSFLLPFSELGLCVLVFEYFWSWASWAGVASHEPRKGPEQALGGQMRRCALLSSLGCQQPASPLLPPLCSHCQSSSWPPPAQARNWYQDQEVSVLIWTADHAIPHLSLTWSPRATSASPGQPRQGRRGPRGRESPDLSDSPGCVLPSRNSSLPAQGSLEADHRRAQESSGEA